MIAYIDSSVVLRVVLQQPGRLAEWNQIVTGITSALTEVECLRTIDRLQVLRALAVEDAANAREAVYRILDQLDVIDLSPALLRRASQPMATPLGTLDALHLSSLELWREVKQQQPIMATHDAQLGTASRAIGYRVLGI